MTLNPIEKVCTTYILFKICALKKLHYKYLWHLCCRDNLKECLHNLHTLSYSFVILGDLRKGDLLESEWFFDEKDTEDPDENIEYEDDVWKYT